MAMNVGSTDGEEDEVVSTINTTPLVDVMLVLLIIFLITIPVVTTSIPVQLPKETNEVRETKPENITLSVDTAGRIYWNDLRIPTTSALIDRLKKVSVLTPQPEVQSAATVARAMRAWAASSTPASGLALQRSASSPSHRLAEAEMGLIVRFARSASWQ